MKVVGSSAAAKQYYAEYAQEMGEAEGKFYDRTGELGIDGQTVTGDEMMQLLSGFSPDGKRALCANAGEHHRGGWDLTFSAPKSVSIVWANADEKLRGEIEAAHEKAVMAGLDYLGENAAITRTGHAGKNPEKAKIVAGIFQHSSNRLEEPQLHTHAVVFNVARTDKDGRWRTLENREMKLAEKTGGAIYKAEMAHQMQRLGFAVERTKNGFEVAGVPERVRTEQSSRAKEIEAALKAQGLTRETAPAHTKEYVTLKTRAAKDTSRITRDFDRWQKENTAFGFGPKEQAEQLPRQRLAPRPSLRRGEQEQLVGTALKDVTLQASTFNKHELARHLAEASIGRQAGSGVRATVERAMRSPEVAFLGRSGRGEERYSTREMIGVERELVQHVKARQGEGRHLVDARTVEASITARPTIKPEQAAALRHITRGRDGVAYVTGDAGTGKSYLMSAVREVYEKEGYTVHGLSFTNKAAQGLERDAGIKSRSVDRFLLDVQNGKAGITSRSVVVLDEAGMLDSRKTLALVKAVTEKGAKLVAVGDEKQIQPILAGQAFGHASRTFGSARLSEIVRQTHEWERKAVRDLAEGRVREGIGALAERGRVKIFEDRNAARAAMVDEWQKGTKEGLAKAPLMLATKNAEVRSLNELARERLKAEGRIGEGHVFETAHGKAEFAAGERIIFTGNDKPRGILNSTMATIDKVDKERRALTVTTETGARLTFKPEEMGKFRHGYAITTHKSQGVTASRALVMVDGYTMDREKLYVGVSRGREGNMIFADKPTVGDLTREEIKALKALPREQRADKESEFFKGHLVSMVGISHQKDTTQDYLEGRAALGRQWDKVAASRESSSFTDLFTKARERLAEKWNAVQERLAEKLTREPGYVKESVQEQKQEQKIEHKIERGYSRGPSMGR